ncbi:flagellar export protein FliJ [Angustibacter aerolatus]
MSAFRLAGLLRMRNLAEEHARRDLGSAQREALTAHERVVAHRAELAGAGAPSGGDAAVFLAQVAARSAMASAVTVAVSEAGLADASLEHARDTWMQARARARAVERLEERHQEQEVAEAGRAEQLANDDLTGARHHRRGLKERVDGDEGPL